MTKNADFTELVQKSHITTNSNKNKLEKTKSDFQGCLINYLKCLIFNIKLPDMQRNRKIWSIREGKSK